MEDNTLIHYGVLGMKWGVRKKSSSKKTSSKKQNKQAKKAYNAKIKSQKKSKYSDISKLSDDELRKRVNRMQLERQYSSMLKDQRYAVSRGKAKTDGILKQEGKNYVRSTVRKTIKKATTKKPF